MANTNIKLEVNTTNKYNLASPEEVAKTAEKRIGEHFLMPPDELTRHLGEAGNYNIGYSLPKNKIPNSKGPKGPKIELIKTRKRNIYRRG